MPIGIGRGNFSQRGARTYGKRAYRKFVSAIVRRHEDRLAEEETVDGPLAPGWLCCECCGGGFCQAPCCNPEWGDIPDEDDVCTHVPDIFAETASYADVVNVETSIDHRWSRDAILDEIGFHQVEEGSDR